MYTRNTELFVERFVFDDVAVYANVQAALAAESPEEPRLVKTRRTFGDAIEITSGLRAGDRIVIRAADKIPRQ